jgi:hypothetical protein
LEAGQQLKGESTDKLDIGAEGGGGGGETQGRGVVASVAVGPPNPNVSASVVGVGSGRDGMKITDFDADADRPAASSNAVSFSFSDVTKRTSDGKDGNSAGNNGENSDHVDQKECATALSSSVHKPHSDPESQDIGSSSSAEEVVSGVDTEMQGTAVPHSLSDQTFNSGVDTTHQNEKGSDEEVLDTYVRDQGQSQEQGSGSGHTERTKRKFNDLDDVQTNELSDHRKETSNTDIKIDIDSDVTLPPIEQLEEAVVGTGLLIP